MILGSHRYNNKIESLFETQDIVHKDSEFKMAVIRWAFNATQDINYCLWLFRNKKAPEKLDEGILEKYKTFAAVIFFKNFIAADYKFLAISLSGPKWLFLIKLFYDQFRKE